MGMLITLLASMNGSYDLCPKTSICPKSRNLDSLNSLGIRLPNSSLWAASKRTVFEREAAVIGVADPIDYGLVGALTLNRFSRQFNLGGQGFIDRIILYDAKARTFARSRTPDRKTA